MAIGENETTEASEATRETSPWAGNDTAFPKGTTHKVMGFRIPASIGRADLEELGSCLVLDGYGEDPLGGEELPALPADEVAEIIECVTKHNNRYGNQISRAAVANALAMARIYRYDHRSVIEMAIRKLMRRRTSAMRARAIAEQRRQLEAKLVDPKAWSLWDVCSGRWLEMEAVEGADGTETVVVDGGPYVLTDAGEERVGTREGVIGMAELVLACDGEDPYDYEGVFRRITFERLTDEGLAYDTRNA